MPFLEYILYACVCFFPFMLLAYYPLRYFKRFNTTVTILLEFAASLVEIIFFVAVYRYFADYPVFFVLIIIVFNPLAYFLIYNVNMGRILFNLLTIVNYASFTVFFAKALETLLFPKMAVQSFRWTNSICILITEIVFILPIAYFIKRCSDDMIKDNSFDFIWRFAWVLPLSLSVLGFLTFYSPRNERFADGMSFYVNTSVFCALVVLCQMIVYYYIAKMIRQQQAVHKLEQDIYYQSIQKVQFRRIEKQIRETRILRHDLRHHITLMCHYVDRQEYDSLKEYLHQCSQSIEQISQLHYTDDPVLNTLLIYYADLCRSKEITFDVRLLFPGALPLKDSEITAVFGNLIENACQACLEMEGRGPRTVRIRGNLKSHFYLFVIDNTYENVLKRDAAGNFATTKPGGSGIGILSAREVVEKHGGELEIRTANHRFEVSLHMPEK